MSEKEQKENRKMTNNDLTKHSDFEVRQNLLGFFNLLLQIDKRNNPEFYKKQFNENYENNRSSNNSDKTK